MSGELAVLCPRDFDLDEQIVTLSGLFTKNKKAAEQPLPLEVAELLRSYLRGRPAGKPIWPGTWHERAADMLRIDLDAAGIPYVIEGPDGPLHADFHCLRHSYVAMLDRSGATLKEAMQLARHSDPKLTMKIYGKARRHDLAGAVERFPSLEARDKTGSKRKRSDPRLDKGAVWHERWKRLAAEDRLPALECRNHEPNRAVRVAAKMLQCITIRRCNISSSGGMRRLPPTGETTMTDANDDAYPAFCDSG